MGCINNEQATLHETNLYGRVKKLLVSCDWSDCSFHLSEKVFKAHKLILGISSPVFEAMFYGPLASNGDVIITDIQPDIFQLLLNYIYTDQVELASIEQAFELLYSSQKYMLEQLTEICTKYILSNISIDNVIDILNYPDFMPDDKILNYSLQLACGHANYLLAAKKKCISYKCITAILECNQINISEKDLILHVFEWTSYWCEQNNIPVTFENRRSIIMNNGLFKLLRFLTLKLEHLEEIYRNSNNLLLSREYKKLQSTIKNMHFMDYFDMKPTNHVNIPRSPVELQMNLCFRRPVRSMAPIVIDSNNCKIHCCIKSNKSVFINTLCVTSRMAPEFYFLSSDCYSEQLSVSIANESDKNIIKFINFKNTVKYDFLCVDIELSEPCYIQKDNWYKISFVWPSDNMSTYSYIAEYRDKQYIGHKATFEFNDLSFDASNGGSFLAGLKFTL